MLASDALRLLSTSGGGLAVSGGITIQGELSAENTNWKENVAGPGDVQTLATTLTLTGNRDIYFKLAWRPVSNTARYNLRLNGVETDAEWLLKDVLCNPSTGAILGGGQVLATDDDGIIMGDGETVDSQTIVVGTIVQMTGFSRLILWTRWQFVQGGNTRLVTEGYAVWTPTDPVTSLDLHSSVAGGIDEGSIIAVRQPYGTA